MNLKTEILDVREDIRNGREPFSKIMSAVARLQPHQELLIIAPFEPAPLYAVMKSRGFRYVSRPQPSGDWEVLFTRQTDPKPAAADAPAGSCGSPVSNAGVVDVDARGLEPPQPMVKILESLVSLPHGAQLQARTDRRPMHLYAQLEQRGFTANTEPQSDGSFITYVRHR